MLVQPAFHSVCLSFLNIFAINVFKTVRTVCFLTHFIPCLLTSVFSLPFIIQTVQLILRVFGIYGQFCTERCLFSDLREMKLFYVVFICCALFPLHVTFGFILTFLFGGYVCVMHFSFSFYVVVKLHSLSLFSTSRYQKYQSIFIKVGYMSQCV